MGARKLKKILLTRDERPEIETKLFVIATEGEKTEKQYFSFFDSARIKIITLETSDGQSSPEHVLRRIDLYITDLEIDKNDEVWLVIDIDQWPQKMLASVIRDALKKNIKTAVSNPCFEVWLLYHFCSYICEKSTCQEHKKRLKKILTYYNHSNINMKEFKDSITDAVFLAEKNDSSPRARWPSPGRTHVYKLIKRLLAY